MYNIANKIFLLIVALITLSFEMPHEPKIPSGIREKQIIFSDVTFERQMLTILTKDELIVYKNDGAGSYQQIQKATICESSSLSISNRAIYDENSQKGPIYNILIGCKSGEFNVYEISLQEKRLTKTFSQHLQQPILKIMSGDSALPYYLVAMQGKVELFNGQSFKKMLEIPTSGYISSMIYDESKGLVLILDDESQIKIQLTSSKTLQIQRRLLIIVQKQVSAPNHGRLLVNQSCGNNITQTNVGQECDDGNAVDGDGCSSTCKNEFCGDGINNNKGLEECDNGDNTPDCIDCKFTCGNGVIDNGQQCDPGDTSNTTNSSDCTDNCTRIAKSSYKAALGVGLGVGFVGLVGVVVGTSVAPAGAGVASSLIGINPAGQIGSAMPTGAISQGAKLFQPL